MLASFLLKIKQVFTVSDKVSKMPLVGVSSQLASKGACSHAEMFKSILNADRVTHQDARNMARAFFNVDLSSNLYVFRCNGPYGTVLGIDNIGFKKSVEGMITDMTIHMRDVTMDTSLRLSVSIKDLDELFKPFHMQQGIMIAGSPKH